MFARIPVTATYRLLLRSSEHVPHVKLGPLLIVVAYAPTDQDCTEEKDQFHSDLDRVMSNGNRLAMVTGDFNASVSERMKRDVCTTQNKETKGERPLSFASANGMRISNIFFHTGASINPINQSIIKHRGTPLVQHPSQALKTTDWSKSRWCICPGDQNPQE